MASTPIGQDEQLQQRIANSLGMPPGGEDLASTDRGRRYGLTIGGQRFLLDLAHHVHVVDVPTAYRLPNTRGWFLGVVNLRGSLVPVFDLAAACDLPEPPPDRRMMLVLGDGDDAAATVIDGPPRHVLVGENQETPMVPILHGVAAPHALRGYRLSDGIWVELDWHGLFLALRNAALTRAVTVDS